MQTLNQHRAAVATYTGKLRVYLGANGTTWVTAENEDEARQHLRKALEDSGERLEDYDPQEWEPEELHPLCYLTIKGDHPAAATCLDGSEEECRTAKAWALLEEQAGRRGFLATTEY